MRFIQAPGTLVRTKYKHRFVEGRLEDAGDEGKERGLLNTGQVEPLNQGQVNPHERQSRTRLGEISNLCVDSLARANPPDLGRCDDLRSVLHDSVPARDVKQKTRQNLSTRNVSSTENYQKIIKAEELSLSLLRITTRWRK